MVLQNRNQANPLVNALAVGIMRHEDIRLANASGVGNKVVRDNSADSRYWGFVDDKLIVGKAFFVWMNFGELSRIGTSIQ